MPQISGTETGGVNSQPVFGKPIQRFSFFKLDGALLGDAAARQRLAAGYKLRLQLPRKGQPDGPATHKGKPDVRTPSPLLRRTELIGLRSSGFFRPSRRAEGLAARLQLFRNGGPNGPAKHKCYPICEPHSHRCGSERDRAAACRFFPGFLGKRTTSSLTVSPKQPAGRTGDTQGRTRFCEPHPHPCGPHFQPVDPPEFPASRRADGFQ